MAVFNDLEADPTQMREENVFFLTIDDYPTDASLIALKREAGLKGLISSINSEKFLTGATDEILDALADKYTDLLNQALTYKQLELFFFDTNGGEESQTYYRWKYYKGMYGVLERRFASFNVDEITSDDKTGTTFHSYKIG